MDTADPTDPMWVDLDFNSPMSDTRAADLVASARPLASARVVDLGCGWAELLLRTVATEPTATGVGVDTDEGAIGYGRATAAARGLAGRIDLQVADAATWSGDRADVLLCIGASHAWGGTAHALAAFRTLLRPAGRLVFGEAFWLSPPTGATLAALGATPDEYGSLADLVALATDAGFRPLSVAVASAEEWDSFESRYARGWERWLLTHPGSPETDQVRARADAHRARWLRGYRGVLGFAYLTLGIPADAPHPRAPARPAR